MRPRYNGLRSHLCGHEQEIAEYIVLTTLLFLVSLIVITTYVDHIGMNEGAGRGATSVTMPPLAFLCMLVVRRRRRIVLSQGAKRWSTQRVAMSIVPHVLYLALVGAVGLPYLEVQLGIAVVWGVFIALPLNYLICHRWSLREAEMV